ncbi:hypothetical protein DL546_006196 [Coniochaeta pulveracea]|uniref:Uncharacterized protein n=1 Tax=Coniochaeta pulveracea TaxID=177199 RepID=A0A420Y593_9PEZI|nr:hypothetical protein DL546_006196 [Coniochaeta pulveracea]
MCIVLLTTAHPSYALIIIDNRDEFILRPTSRPHWWISGGDLTHQNANSNNADKSHANGQPRRHQEILCSRDLQRAEHGTWLGITKNGNVAVLTNFREDNIEDKDHPVHAARSRGGMVTAWLEADPEETTAEFVKRILDGGVRNVGGFSLLCGKLRKNDEKNSLKPLAIISNRTDNLEGIPWIGTERHRAYGLSNTSYHDPVAWPKVENGKRLLTEAVKKAVNERLDEDGLMDELFKVLDTDTLPVGPDMGFEDYIPVLKESIFVPPIGDEHHREAMERASRKGKKAELVEAEKDLLGEERPTASSQGFDSGMYGTQRQTIILVDWDGNVTFRERALWDAHGDPIERPAGDMTFKFKVDGWHEKRESEL